MARRVLITSIIAGSLAFLTMFVTTVTWMTVPGRIIYRESSPFRTDQFNVKVVEHGSPHFLTPAQKKIVDTIRRGTGPVWFGSLAIIIVSILAGAAARIQMPYDPAA